LQSIPFNKPGRFYRGNLHCHSTYSDGTLSPEEVIAAYRGEGYDFVALTDHFWRHGARGVNDTRPLRTPEFTTLLGAELHAPRMESGVEWHLLGIGLPPDFAAPGESETMPEIARRAAHAGAFVGLAHPKGLNMTLADALSIDVAHGVEVWSDMSAQTNDAGESWYMADMLATYGHRRTAFASDDAHFWPGIRAFGGWVQVRAEALDPDALLAALKAGHYYASHGPEIYDIAIDGDALHVRCSPARLVAVTGRGNRYAHRAGERITEATLPLAGVTEAYCRVTVVDAEGKRAWSNPIWFD